VCQHRAHERILADRAIAAAEGRPVESQRLVIPFTAEIGPRALAAVEENSTLLADLGFEVEPFGGASVLVRAVPTLVANKDYEVAFHDLVEDLAGGGAGLTIQERRRTLLTMLSCKNAIKAGDPLQMPQIQNLLDDLMTVTNPSICPHGQPILIKISTLELDKKFEREYASRQA
jgi:DNA mismatch repair protein MutL